MEKILKPLALFICVIISVAAKAQDGYTLRNDSIDSKILKQTRRIIIYLPEGYDKSAKGFPVVYVLDAGDRIQHTVPTARFLFANGKMPKAIIVGVLNIDRNHDFLPDSIKSAPTGGGADNFARFFREELMPYVAKNFKTEGYNVLVGHSYGGVFAMNTLITDPTLFDSYIAIDPSFWYKDRMMIKKTHDEFGKGRNWNRAIFITGREGEGMKGMGVDAMDSLLKQSAPAGLVWKVVPYAGEDHGSVTFKSVYDGLRFIFDSGSNFNVYPESGILPKGTFAYAIVDNNNPALHYTLDGSEPTAGSPFCTDTIRITCACTLKVKSVRGIYTKSPAITRVFTEGEYLKGPKSVKNLKPGLKYSYYEGVWDSLPDFTKLKVVKKGITPEPDLSMAVKRDSFGVRFEGYLHIAKQGLYYIWITSDDGSKVYLNNSLLLNNDGLHDNSRPSVRLVPLEPGYYPLTIDFFERTGGESVTLGTVTDKMQPVPFPKEVFFHRE
ncbi:MAG TPA: alpha/beta hydrolase-fold protein [Bacteroidales bacterium]|nr:alpha/beta hydrolase-fold protein [Bacteroidales bacterium]